MIILFCLIYSQFFVVRYVLTRTLVWLRIYFLNGWFNVKISIENYKYSKLVFPTCRYVAQHRASKVICRAVSNKNLVSEMILCYLFSYENSMKILAKSFNKYFELKKIKFNLKTKVSTFSQSLKNVVNWIHQYLSH